MSEQITTAEELNAPAPSGHEHTLRIVEGVPFACCMSCGETVDTPSDDDREALIERLRGSADAWWSEYDRELRAHEETKAALAAVTAERDALAARSPQPARVHNHGPEGGPGLACPELRLTDGQLIGMCLVPEPTRSRMTQTAPSVRAETILLVQHAKGLVEHTYMGLCPDDDPDARDPECPVCAAIDALSEVTP